MAKIVSKKGKQYCVFRRIDEDQEFDVLMSIKDDPTLPITTKISHQAGDFWKEEKVRPNLPPPRSACPHDPENPDPESTPNPPRIAPNLQYLTTAAQKSPNPESAPNPPRIRPESVFRTSALRPRVTETASREESRWDQAGLDQR